MKISEEYIWHLKAKLRERPVFHIHLYNKQGTMLFQMLIKCAPVKFFHKLSREITLMIVKHIECSIEFCWACNVLHVLFC